ncbi:MAG: SGNH/GDSL hydrolase family protein [Candidatus Thiodiazotropha lotti]|nr:SGNH/GDSL hydrolase family protein [Candidatus Thiodiazotropha lotti]MCW4221830.1 SGNH/GDSL hydrolase family protein [Candidatus Thiodiazotropha lotti]
MGEMKHVNDATTVLASALGDTDLVMEVASSVNFPTLGAGDWFWATIRRAADGEKEQVRVTAISGTTWTIERGTIPLAFAAADGVYQRMNSQFADDLLRPDMQVLGQFAVAGGTGNAMTASLDKAPRSLVDGIEISVRAVGGNTVMNPTLDLDSYGALTITRLGQQPLEIGDIPRAGYEMKLRYRDSPAGWELLNPVNLPHYAGRIVVLGASESVFPWSQTWVDHMRNAFASEGLNIDVFHTGAGALTHDTAMNDVDALTGQTRVELTNSVNADLIIVELGLNDAILAVGSLSQVQMIADATALYADIRANNPDALICYSPLIPYDSDAHSAVPIGSVKKKFCVPYMHETSTKTGESGKWTTEYSEINQVLSSTMQDRLTNWKALDAAIRALPTVDIVLETNYFRPARLGLVSHDRVHPNSQGHYFLMSQVWTEFQNNATIRAAIPELQKLRVLGDFTDFDRLWNSATMADADLDGYEIDPDWTNGFDYPMWINVYGNTGLISHAAYWGNQQRPAIDVSDRVNRSIEQSFDVMMNGLWPGAEIFTKMWLDGDSEPTTWSADVPPKLSSKTGTHIGNDRPTLPAGDYWIKYRVGDDVFGPFPIALSGAYSSGSGAIATFSRSSNETLSSGWDFITLNVENENEASSVISLNATNGQVSIAAPSGHSYTHFKVSAHCTIDANAVGRHTLCFSRNGVDQHDAFSSDSTYVATTAAFPPLSISTLWLPIDAAGEVLEMITNLPTLSAVVLASFGITFQVELR